MQIEEPLLHTPQKTKNYDYLSLINFETPNKNSSFGLLPDLKSSPHYAFGSETREKSKILYLSKDLAKKVKGLHSPGVFYDVENSFQYKNSPQWSMSQMPIDRFVEKVKYDYYERNDYYDLNPTLAYLKLKPKAQGCPFGLQNRFGNESLKNNKSPGPQYDIKTEFTHKAEPKVSIGIRREQNIFSSTPNIVGPGSYSLKNPEILSKLKTIPKVSFPKKIRDDLSNKTFDKNQTFAQKEGIGLQVLSNKKTSPSHSFGTGTRTAKLAFYKQFFVHHAKNIVSLPMPIL